MRTNGSIAQLVERLAVNQCVGSSSLSTPAKNGNLIQKAWSFPAKKCVPLWVYGASP